MDLLYLIILGAVAGWLASKIMKGSSSGLLINIILGIIGSAVGGWCFTLLGLAQNGLIGSLITATVGAMIVLFVYNKFIK